MVNQIEILSKNLTFPEFEQDRLKRAAFERFVEIISEASRHLGDDLKSAYPDIEWRNIADIGNHLRHAYHRVDPEILWNLQEYGHLSRLKQACLSYLNGK